MAGWESVDRFTRTVTLCVDRSAWAAIEAAAARAGLELSEFVQEATVARALADAEPGSEALAGAQPGPPRSAFRPSVGQRKAWEQVRHRTGETRAESRAIMAEAEQALHQARVLRQQAAVIGAHLRSRPHVAFRMTPDCGELRVSGRLGDAS